MRRKMRRKTDKKPPAHYMSLFDGRNSTIAVIKHIRVDYFVVPQALQAETKMFYQFSEIFYPLET